MCLIVLSSIFILFSYKTRNSKDTIFQLVFLHATITRNEAHAGKFDTAHDSVAVIFFYRDQCARFIKLIVNSQWSEDLALQICYYAHQINT